MDSTEQGHCTVCGDACLHCASRASRRERWRNNPAEYFWQYVSKGGVEDCWEWHGGKDDREYGRCSYEGRVVFAHRASWMIHFGPIPEGLVVRHRCDNPPCVNPDHLELGTQADNVRDTMERGRHWSQQEGQIWVRRGLRRFSNEQARAIKARVLEGESPTAIARELGIRKFAIQQLVTGQTYKDI